MKKWNVVSTSEAPDTDDQVEADSMEIDYYGTLIFYRKDEMDRPVIIRAFAHGGWTEVERVR